MKIFALLFSSLAFGQTLPVTGTAVPELSSLDTAMQGLLVQYRVPGAALGVVHKGALVFVRGYGYSDLTSMTSVQPDSLFRIASDTKPHTAAAIMKLIERGKLSPDDKAFTILSNLQPLPGATEDPRIAQITVQNLLDHKSGWYGEGDGTGYDPLFDVVNIAKAAGAAPPADPDTIVRYMLGKRLDRDPGSYYSYSNFGYLILGEIVKKISGESFETFVTANVTGPLGNHLTQFGATLTPLPHEVTYYPNSMEGSVSSVFPTGPPVVSAPYGGYSLEANHANGGLVSNTIELLQFAASINGSRGPSLFQTSVSGFPGYVPPSGPGWSWFFHGSLPGNNSSIILLPDQTLICWLSNLRPVDYNGSAKAFDDALISAVQNISSWPTADQFPQYATSFRVVNAATYVALPVASDQFVTITGNNLATSTDSAASVPLPTSLGGATVTITDSTGASAQCGLVYASPAQINLVVPPGIALGAAMITVAGAQTLSAQIEIDSVVPGLFTANSSGTGVPAAIATRVSSAGDQTPVTVFNCPAAYQCAPAPINLGASTDTLILSLYGTGIRHASALSNVSATVKGQPAPVQYAGAQGAYAGLDQVNIVIPYSLKGSGAVPVQVTVDGRTSNIVTINIQ